MARSTIIAASATKLAAAGRGIRGDSDTEVLLEACAFWGVEGAIERAIGMFAFALWDRATRTLSLVRDRLGIKPLYYVATPKRLLFASQLRAFRAAPDWRPTIDEDAVVGFLRHSYIAQPRTIYREAAKLPPGHFLTLRCGRGPELNATGMPVRSRWEVNNAAIRHLTRTKRSSGSMRCSAIP